MESEIFILTSICIDPIQRDMAGISVPRHMYCTVTPTVYDLTQRDWTADWSNSIAENWSEIKQVNIVI